METVLRDLVFALRSLRRRPGFAMTALLTLALGIGATTAIFSVVRAVILRPLPYRDPDRIVVVQTDWLKRGERGPLSSPDFHDLHDQTGVFDAIASLQPLETGISIGSRADYAVVVRVSAEFFRALGATTQVGRVLSQSEERPAGKRVAVITDAFWRREFSGSADAIGSAVTIGQRAYEIVGVLRPWLRYPATADVYVLNDRPDMGRGAHNLLGIARLRPGITVAQARADVSALARRLEQQYPATNDAKGFAITPLQDFVVGDVRLTLYVLLAAVGVVLLIAATNVANLLLTRATTRQREMVVRTAVGASRGRLVRQLLTESALLGMVAGAIGVLLARIGVATLARLAPADLPRIGEVHVDATTLTFTATISIIASLLFGAAPALQASRVRLADGFSAGNTGAVGSRGAWLRNAFVVSQVAFAVVLVTGAVLLGRSLAALTEVNLGYSTEHVLAIRTSVPISRIADLPRATAFYRELLPAMRALPGVTAAGATMAPPTILASNGAYTIEGRAPGGINGPNAVFSIVTPDYFRAMRIPLRSGREFTDADRLDAPFVAVVSESLARAAFPHENPIGRRIQAGFDSPAFMTIVGVAGDVRTGGPDKGPQQEIYMPAEQHQVTSALTLIVRADTSDPADLGGTIARQIRRRDSTVPVRVRFLGDLVSTAVETPRFRTYLLSTFATVALLLATAGVYGVMAFGVSQRIAEIGLRVALGARPRDVLTLVMRQGVGLTLAGLAVGLTMSLALSRLIAGLLFGVTATDPATTVLVVLVVGCAAVAACYLPALTATRVTPLQALRTE
jgi:putative ABC transport system permease protein